MKKVEYAQSQHTHPGMYWIKGKCQFTNDLVQKIHMNSYPNANIHYFNPSGLVMLLTVYTIYMQYYVYRVLGLISLWFHYELLRKSKDYVYGIWVYKALGIWKGYYRVKNHWFRTWNREQRQEIINIWNITPNLHTNSHFELWAEKWTIMHEASGSSTAPNAARRISC